MKLVKINISLKDGTKIELITSDINSISFERNSIKINYRAKDITFENHMVDSFTVAKPSKFVITSGNISYACNLIIILTNILYNSN